VQSEILSAHPNAKLKVYAIWANKLFGDARNRWDAAGLTDRRVTHLWDGPDTSGGWLAGNVDGYDGSDWDIYLLFGPDATWQAQPEPLLSGGGPVDTEIETLKQAIAPLLAP
jgi:hypothetical protein